MGLLSALENAQVNIFNKIGALRKLQGVKTNSPVTIVARRSFADLGTIQRDQMVRIFHVPKRNAWFERSKWFAPMLMPLWVGSMWMMWRQNSEILETVESNADHVNTLDNMSKFLLNAQRIAAVLIGAAGAAYLALFPSRSVQAIYLAKHNYRRCLVVQCGRLIGSVPTYYVFDGKEEVRITEALYHQATESLGAQKTKASEKIANEKMREYDQMIRGNKENRKINVSPISFFGGRLVYSPNLSLCGETPRIPPAWLSLNAKYGEFTIKRAKLNEHAATFGLLQLLIREIENEQILARDAAFNTSISKKTWWIKVINALQLAFVLGAWQILLPNGLPGIGDLGVLSSMLQEQQRQANQLNLEVQLEQHENVAQMSNTIARKKRVTDDLE